MLQGPVIFDSTVAFQLFIGSLVAKFNIMIYILYRILYTVQCIVYSVHCTVYTVLSTVYCTVSALLVFPVCFYIKD